MKAIAESKALYGESFNWYMVSTKKEIEGMSSAGLVDYLSPS